MGVKGYKVFEPDWTCRGFQYEVGKTYKHEGDIELCKAGFHFCQKIADCFCYYSFDSKNKIAEVEATGLIKTEGNKTVTNEIRIVREISWIEMLTMANMGKDCVGVYNTNDFNTGNGNTGRYNIGDYNTGSRNIGNCNAGCGNTGTRNTGDFNTGDGNTGDWNTGNFNTGSWNKTDFSSGFFNTKAQPIYAFNKELNISRDEFCNCEGLKVLSMNFGRIWLRQTNDMTDEEKQAHPEYKAKGGYFKTVDFKTVCKMVWNELIDDDKQAVMEIPNFDAEIFKEITGIDVNEGEN